jgi:2-oxoglutarate dehydrogenase E2 component (dihydrolipoamide succinyltransferase)
MADIVVPEMGESVVDARVTRWLKSEGDSVKAGEPLVSLETDKVDVEVAAPTDGTLEAILHQPGADVKIGDVLGRVAAGTGKAAAPAAPAGNDTGKAPTEAAPVAATPSARKAARDQQVPIASVPSDGPRITRADVDKAAGPKDRVSATNGAPETRSSSPEPRPSPAAGRPAPPPPAPPRPAGDRTEERVRMSKRRATIARRLVEAQSTAAMLTTFNEVDMSAVMSFRERQKEAFKKKFGVSLGISSFFVKAAVVALGEIPRLNAEVQGDEMVLKRYFDIGVAVGAAEGLVVPVLRDADRMTLADIERRIREFAAKANDGTLSLDDIKGGSFSITNGGVFGSMMSTPILNPPQVGILGLHAIKERPVGVNGQVVLRPMMYTALTYDHRIVDGAEAVRFLVRVKELIEDPVTLLIG